MEFACSAAATSAAAAAESTTGSTIARVLSMSAHAGRNAGGLSTRLLSSAGIRCHCQGRVLGLLQRSEVGSTLRISV